MQNRYAVDVGDFMKLGLLRYVAASPSERMSGSSWNFGGGLHGLTVTQ